jgi:alkylation response protein AidB-like acyl-CoA dehydrogenase
MNDQKESSQSIQNQVLTNDAHHSQNFYLSDHILRHYLRKNLDKSAIEYLDPKLMKLGEQAAKEMDELSLKADKHPPELIKRTPEGEKAERIEFHPAYQKMLKMAVESEMIYLKYEPDLKEKFKGLRHQMGFAAGQLFAMSEVGLYCPLCMTDGAAYVLENYAGDERVQKIIKKLSSRTEEEVFTGAMFLTEKSGGSDVGRNITKAERVEGKTYRMTGEKWFCSNVNAEIMMVLARTGREKEGTRGLSLFLVEKYLEDGSRNPLNIIRLKEKLGVRSMATGEVELTGTLGTRLGEEGNGFKLMANMINMSRLYNSLTAVAAARRAIVESWEYLNHRVIFGKRAVEHPLIRQKFHELGSLHIANFLLVWQAIKKLDSVEDGHDEQKAGYRTLLPMAKWWSAETAVYMVRECMELMGGNGYIEDFIMPKLLRDVNVLPIWEGSGNVIVLDILRSLDKADGFNQLVKEMEASFGDEEFGELLKKETEQIKEILASISNDNREELEATAKPLFKRFIHVYQVHLMIEDKDKKSKKWLHPALSYMKNMPGEKLGAIKSLPLQEIENLIGWKY